MADARHGVQERGKSDPIEAFAIARAALREGVETLPTARLARPRLEIRQLGLHRKRLVDARKRAALAPTRPLARLGEPRRALIHLAWQTKVTHRLNRAARTVQVQSARDMISHARELTRTITKPHEQLAGLMKQVAPQLVAENGLSVLIGENYREIDRDQPLHQRRATRAHLRMRPDPHVLRTDRPSLPRPRRQPPPSTSSSTTPTASRLRSARHKSHRLHDCVEPQLSPPRIS